MKILSLIARTSRNLCKRVQITRVAAHALLGVGLAVAALGLVALPAQADSVAIGVISFDVINPSLPGNPGQNSFTIFNATGLFSLFPDLPVASNVTFLGATLTLLGPGNPGATSLGDVSPGSLQDFVLGTNVFSSALFQATLSQTLFLLSNGTTFKADSNVISATLLPSSGNDLTAGEDFLVLTVSGSPVINRAPEPSSLFLLFLALPLIFWSAIAAGRKAVS
jgi:hypothetical protein